MPEGQGYQYDVKIADGSTRRITLDRQMSPEELQSPAFLEALGKQLAPPGGPFQSGVPGAEIGAPDPSTIPDQPSMPAEVAKAIPENVLGAVGEIGGAAVGGVPGRVAGQFVGGAIGRAGSDLVTEGTIDPAGAARAGAEQVVGGEGMRLVGKAAGKAFTMLKPYVPILRREVDPAIADSLSYFSAFSDPVQHSRFSPSRLVGAEREPLMSPGDILQSPGLRTLENIARGSLLVGDDMLRLDRNMSVATDRALNEIVREFGPRASREDIGHVLQATIQEKDYAARQALKPIYNAIEKATTPVPVKRLKEVAPATTREVETGILDDAGKPITRSEPVPAQMQEVTELEGGVKVRLQSARKYAQSVAQVSRDLNSVNGAAFGDDLVKRIESIDDLPFPEVQELRERLLYMQRKAKESGLKTPATRQLAKLVNGVDKAMENALKREAPEWLEPWREANRVYKANAEKYQNRFILQLMRLGKRGSLEGTETFAKIFQRGKSKNVERLFTAVQGDEQAETFARQVFTKKLLDESMENGRLNGGQLLANMQDDALYRSAFDRAYTKEQQHALRRFAERLQVVQRAQDLPGDARNPWLKFGQISKMIQMTTAVATMGASGSVTSGLPIILTPALAAKILSSPVTAKLLIDGLHVPPTSKAGANIMRRLTLEVAKQAMPEGGGEVALPEPEPTTVP